MSAPRCHSAFWTSEGARQEHTFSQWKVMCAVAVRYKVLWLQSEGRGFLMAERTRCRNCHRWTVIECWVGKMDRSFSGGESGKGKPNSGNWNWEQAQVRGKWRVVRLLLVENREGGLGYRKTAQLDRDQDTDNLYVMLGVWTLSLRIKANWISFHFPFPLVASPKQKSCPTGPCDCSSSS